MAPGRSSSGAGPGSPTYRSRSSSAVPAPVRRSLEGDRETCRHVSAGGRDLRPGEEQATAEVGAAHVGRTEVGAEQVRRPEIDPAQVRADEVGAAQTAVAQVGAPQVPAHQIGAPAVPAAATGPYRGADPAEQLPDLRPAGGDVEGGQLVGRAGGQALGRGQRRPYLAVQRGGTRQGERLGQVPEHLVQLPQNREDGELRGREVRALPPGPAAERDLGELLAGAEAVEHLAAREAPLAQLGVDAAAEVLPQVRAGPAGRLVDREVRRCGERRGDAAEPRAAGTVGAQVRPCVGQGTSTTLPTVLRSPSALRAWRASSNGRVWLTRGSMSPSSTRRVRSSCTVPNTAGSYFRYRPQCRPTTL